MRRRPLVVQTVTGIRCAAPRCPLSGTRFARWAWWCPDHEPDHRAMPTCGHSLSSVVNGIRWCSYCGGAVA